MSEIRIYVAHLASYVDGKLHGVHIDLEPLMTAEELQEIINEKVIATAPVSGEEWAIHDSEGFEFGEYENLQTIERFCEVWDGHNEEIIEAIADNHSSLEVALDVVESGDYVVHESWNSIIDEWIEIYEIPEKAAYYIDRDAVRRDLEMEGTYLETSDGRVIYCY